MVSVIFKNYFILQEVVTGHLTASSVLNSRQQFGPLSSKNTEDYVFIKYYKFWHGTYFKEVAFLALKIILTSAKTDFHPGLHMVLRPSQKSVSAEFLTSFLLNRSFGGCQLALHEIRDMQKLKPHPSNRPKLSLMKWKCKGNIPETLVQVSSLSSQLHEPESLLSHQVLAELLTPGREVFESHTLGEDTQQVLL